MWKKYRIQDVGYDGDNFKKDKNGKYVMYGTVYGNCGEEDDFDFTYDINTKEITITKINDIFSTKEIDDIKDILLDNLKTNFLGD